MVTIITTIIISATKVFRNFA